MLNICGNSGIRALTLQGNEKTFLYFNFRLFVCTKTALQLGEKPATGLNNAILYLMLAPFAIVGFVGYRWWRGNKKFEEEQ